MLKIEIHILSGQLDIEIKKNDDQFVLLVILSKSEYFREKGRVWTAKTADEEKVLEIVNMIKECYVNPSIPKMITINDGIHSKIDLQVEETKINFIIEELEEGTKEFDFRKKIFTFINELVQDTDLEYYSRSFLYLR
jgi:hypothetical protein